MSTIAFDDLLDQLSSNEHRRVKRLLEANDIEFDDSDDWVRSTVFDGRAMNVRYQIDGDTCRYHCTCDQFQKTPEPPCAHVIAVLNTAELTERLDTEGLLLTPVRDTKPAEEPEPEPSYWKKAVSRVQAMHEQTPDHEAYWPSERQLMYMIDVSRTTSGAGLVIQTISRDRKRDGTWGKVQIAGISRRIADALADPLDRDIVSMLIGANAGGFYYDGFTSSHQHLLSPTLARTVMPMLCQTGRCMLPETDIDGVLHPLAWDPAGPWKLRLAVDADDRGDYVVTGELMRGEDRMGLNEPAMLTHAGFVFTKERVAPLDDAGAFEWIVLLRDTPRLQVPRDEISDLIGTLNRGKRLPTLRLPSELMLEEVSVPAKPRLRLRAPKRTPTSVDDRLRGDLSFDYGGTIVGSEDFAGGYSRSSGIAWCCATRMSSPPPPSDCGSLDSVSKPTATAKR